MQTFLPFRDFYKISKCLDYRRLGKQRVEALQIIRILELEEDSPFEFEMLKAAKRIPWLNHPAVRMWRGYLPTLKSYHNHMITEWVHRGYKNTMKYKSIKASDIIENRIYPTWWYHNDEVFRSHRSNLLRKNREHYAQYFESDLPDNLPYVWPV